MKIANPTKNPLIHRRRDEIEEKSQSEESRYEKCQSDREGAMAPAATCGVAKRPQATTAPIMALSQTWQTRDKQLGVADERVRPNA